MSLNLTIAQHKDQVLRNTRPTRAQILTLVMLLALFAATFGYVPVPTPIRGY